MVLFCTIRRVIPIREVTTALFTGKVFQPQEKSPTDSTWCIGTLETGEECDSTDISLPPDNDYFALRQPKFEIVVPPLTVLPDQAVTLTTTQTTQVAPTHRAEIVVHVNLPRTPIPRTKSIPRKPLPREPSICDEDNEGYDRSSSFSCQKPIRRLPPIPHRSRPVASTPPPYRSAATHSRQYSVSRFVPSHSHSRSLDSVVSDTPLMSGLTMFGSTIRDSLGDGGSSC